MATRNKTAWVVDDDAVNRFLAVSFLQHMGWETREFLTGQETLDAARSGFPALMVIDISMPAMSGTELVSRLRQQPASRHTRFVAYTAHCLSEETQAMKRAGFHHILTKPVSYQHMLEAVDDPAPVDG
jgi:CheY-like chemotaxis protein